MLAELKAVLAADLRSQDDAAKLSGLLYDRCYTHSILDVPQPPAKTSVKPDLTEALVAANRSCAAWIEGWKIDQVLGDGRIAARKNGALRTFLPGQYVTRHGVGGSLEEGLEITLFSAPGSAGIQAGFYYAFGEAVSEYEPGESLLRVYWNIQADGAPRLMDALTRELNRFQVPFRFKCLNRSSHFPRRDAAVLYIHRRYYPIAAILVERVHSAVLPWLNQSTPLFAKPLSHGLALAEDPGDSFGKHRCAILAAAMVASQGKPVEARLDEVRRQFEERGLSFDAPWLNAKSPGLYEFPFSTE